MAEKIIDRNLRLNPHEMVISFVRPAGRMLLSTLLMPALIIAAPFLLLFPLFGWGQPGIIIFFSVEAIGLIWLLKIILRWWLSGLIITNQRVVDIDQSGLLDKTVSDVPLTKIEDALYRIKGLGQNLGRVGTVYLSINGSTSKIVVPNVAQPQKIQQLILQLRNDIIRTELKQGQLSAEELVRLIKQIKIRIGPEKFNQILKDSGHPQPETIDTLLG